MRNKLEFPFLKFKKEYFLSGIIFLYLIIIHLPWVIFKGIPAEDTIGYVDVSINWFNSDYIYMRPIVYPIFLHISKLIGSNEFGAIVYIQILFYALSGSLFFYILVRQKLNLGTHLLAVLVLISFSVPQALGANQIVLPEILPLFFILLLFHFLLKPPNLINSLIISLFIIIPILLKPLWLLLLIFPVIKFIYSKKHHNQLIFGCILPIAFTVSLYSTNQFIVAKEGVNTAAASTFDASINLSLIRMGLIDSGNTKLHSFLNKNRLLSEIDQRKWTGEREEFNRFTDIKNKIPWEYREDKFFWQNILLEDSRNLLKYFSTKISRLPAFFSTSSENGRVEFLPPFMDRLYQRFFDNLHSKHIAGMSFIIFGFYIGLFNFKNLSLHKFLFFLIIGVAVILCLLTYQDQHFYRMRAAIEPFIIYIVLYVSIKILKWFWCKINSNSEKPYLKPLVYK